jgi:hypothetical protein
MIEFVTSFQQTVDPKLGSLQLLELELAIMTVLGLLRI